MDREVTRVARGGQTQDDASPEFKYTKEDLKAMQSWDLNRKIQVSQTRLIEWYKNWDGKCYVSFSGGKDSTVLAYLAAQVCTMLDYKLILWFSDTGLEFPEIRQHVKTFPDYLRSKFLDLEVELIMAHPTYGKADKVTGKKKGERITFRDVIKKYGYPIISKEVANIIYEARNKPDGRSASKFDPNSDYVKKYGEQYCLAKWNWLKDSDIPISGKCCYAMKKSQAKRYEKESGNVVINGTMAFESLGRKTSWMMTGCNSFIKGRYQSKPLSFWLEQDILRFIYEYSLPLARVYGEIKYGDDNKFYLTGRSRTGCIFCGFGCHLEKEPNRYQQLKQTHPGLWEYCMKPYDEGGLGMKEVLDYINVKTGAED